MKRLRQAIAVVLILTLGITGCSQTQTQAPNSYTPPIPPKITGQQAQDVVIAAIQSSTPTTQQSSGWYHAEFNYSTRQWMITVWASENASKQYAGMVYIVDDANGILLSPPPMYNPQTTQATPSDIPAHEPLPGIAFGFPVPVGQLPK